MSSFFQQEKLRVYSKSKGIAFECYAPLGSPSRMGIDPDEPVVMEDPVINEIATKYNATPAQICISFLLHLGLIVIPKSVSESRILQNLKATEISLTAEEVDRLKAIDKNLHLRKFYHLASHLIYGMLQRMKHTRYKYLILV